MTQAPSNINTNCLLPHLHYDTTWNNTACSVYWLRLRLTAQSGAFQLHPASLSRTPHLLAARYNRYWRPLSSEMRWKLAAGFSQPFSHLAFKKRDATFECYISWYELWFVCFSKCSSLYNLFIGRNWLHNWYCFKPNRPALKSDLQLGIPPAEVLLCKTLTC